MSEVRYRSQLRQLLTAEEANSNYANFVEALLASVIPMPEQLKIVLEGDREDIKPTAGYLVGELQIHDLVPTLIRLYDTAPYESPLQHVILHVMTFRNLRHEKCHQFFLAIMQDKQLSAGFRISALSGLERGKDPDAIAPLLALAQDTSENPYLRGAAIRTLAQQNDKSLLPVILTLLNDTAPEVQYEAVCAVGVLGDASLKSHIEPLLQDKTSLDGQVAWAAREILDQWASREAN